MTTTKKKTAKRRRTIRVPSTRDVARVLNFNLDFRQRAMMAQYLDTADIGQLAEVAHHLRVELEREGRDKRTGERAEEAAPLSDGEVRLAAMYFATSNLGQRVPEKPTSVAQIRRAWDDCVRVHGYEGIDVGHELKDWIKIFQKGDSFSVARWTGVKASITDLPAVQGA